MRNTTLATLHKLLKNSFLMVLLLALPLGASAAGLGKLSVLSALGQPLRAEVELTASREEISSLSARIASPNAFQQAGIEYSPALAGLRFIVGQRTNGQPFLSIQSDRPFNEPFLDLLVELSWSSGRLVREYTFLLDPPESLQKTPAPSVAVPQLPEIKREAVTAVQPPAIVPPGQAGKAGATPLAPPDETIQKKPRSEMQVIRGADGVQRIVKVEPPARDKLEKQPVTRLVKRGDTLGKIAAETKPEGVNLDQMLLALFRGNQEAFVGNVNRLKAGKILAIPDRETVASVNVDEARKTIQAHAADFNAYSKKLASSVASGAAVPEAPTRAVSGKIAPKVEDKAPAATAGKDKLEVSKAGVVAGVSGKEGAGRIAAIEETLVSREKALKEANSRIVELEKNLNDLKKLVELKSQGLAELQKQAQVAKPDVPKAEVKEPAPAPAKPVEKVAETPTEKLLPAAAPAPAEPAQPVTATKPAEPVPPPAPKPAPADKPPTPPAVPAPTPTEPSFIDDSPEIVYGGGGILALLLAYLGYSKWRKQRQVKDQGIDSANYLMSGTSPDQEVTDELLPPTDISSQSDMPGMEPVAAVDPVAEADVYLAYGRDAQAEEILVDALKSDPTRHAIHLKLLEIYAKRKSAKQFETIASDLHNQTSGSGPDWEKAAELGQQVDPNNPLYGAVKAAAPEEFDASATLVIQPQDVLENLAVAETMADDQAQPSPEAAEIPPEIEPIPQEPQEEVPVSLDFDFNLPVTKDAEASESLLEDLSAPSPEKLPGSLDIDLDLPVEPQEPTIAAMQEAASTPAAASSSEAETGLDFDFDLGDGKAPETPALAEPSDSNVIDFDLELPEPAEPAAAKPAAPSLDLSSISLELDQPLESTPPPDASKIPELDDAALQDVATKLELAQAYEEMGDKEGARELLQEVLNEGDAAQQEAARNKLAQLG